MPDKKLTIRDETSEFLLYTSPQGEVRVEVLLGEETIWLTLNRMATLFGIDKSGISCHLKNIYESGELEREATVAKIATVRKRKAFKLTAMHSMLAFVHEHNFDYS